MSASGRSRLWKAAQIVFVAAVLVYIAIAIRGQWGAVQSRLTTVRPSWPRVLLSMAIVVASYAVLADCWRRMLATWAARLSLFESARIWSVSNLGRYLPGKVWQIASMIAMAQERGVSPVASVGSAVVVNLVNVLTGFAVVLAAGAQLFDVLEPGSRQGAVALAALLAVGFLALPVVLPSLVRLASRVTRRSFTVPNIPPRTLWLAAAGTGLAWLLYGVAFEQFVAAVLGQAPGPSVAYISVYTISYLAGYLFLPAPAGIGVREGALVGGLTGLGLTSEADAWVVAWTSRLWLTVLEILPGLLFIIRDAYGTRRRGS